MEKNWRRGEKDMVNGGYDYDSKQGGCRENGIDTNLGKKKYGGQAERA